MYAVPAIQSFSVSVVIAGPFNSVVYYSIIPGPCPLETPAPPRTRGL